MIMILLAVFILFYFSRRDVIYHLNQGNTYVYTSHSVAVVDGKTVNDFVGIHVFLAFFAYYFEIQG